MQNIFVVDDEKDLLDVIKSYLEKEDYNVRTFQTAQSAIDAIEENVDLWLLDIMLGDDISGFDIIKKINQSNPKPVIFMSARDKDFDKILGLEMGSEDYITKPFSMREMVLRVQNVLKRSMSVPLEKVIHYADYVINEQKRIVTLKDEKISLTSKEFDLLITLLLNKGVPLTRDKLLTKVWGIDYYGSDRVVDDLVKRIRKKLPDLNIETVYGHGYRLT